MHCVRLSMRLTCAYCRQSIITKHEIWKIKLKVTTLAFASKDRRLSRNLKVCFLLHVYIPYNRRTDLYNVNTLFGRLCLRSNQKHTSKLETASFDCIAIYFPCSSSTDFITWWSWLKFINWNKVAPISGTTADTTEILRLYVPIKAHSGGRNSLLVLQLGPLIAWIFRVTFE